MRLKQLDNPLLFLRHLEKIEWKIKDGDSGAYLKTIESRKSDRIVSIMVKINNQSFKYKFIVFDKKIEDSDQFEHIICIAFELDPKGDKVTSDHKFPAYCFFSTHQDTGLKFIVQAPFLLTDNRAEIVDRGEWNNNLIKQIATVIADSLPKIKDMELLNVDFLNVLPISEADFPTWHMFRPVYDAVLNKLKNDEKLLPANDGSHISAKEALLGRGRELIDLLSSEQLSLLSGKQNAHWLDSNITEKNPLGLWDYLNKKLDIEIITPGKFAEQFNKEFIEKQTDDWIINLYRFLGNPDQESLWSKHTYRRQAESLRNKPFIRLENNTHAIPFDSNKPQAYLPSNSSYSNKTVKKKIATDEGARNFLIKLGLSEPNKITEIIEDILPKYQKGDIKPSEEENIEDFKRFLQALETDSVIDKNRLIEELKNTPFLLAFNNATNEMIYKKSSEIYLSEAYTSDSDLETYFKGYDKAYFLSPKYKSLDSQEKLCKFFYELHIENKPKMIKFDPQFSWEEKRQLIEGDHTRDIECVDYDIDGLEHFLKNNLTSKNAIILWRNLLKHIRGLQTLQLNSFFQGQYHWFYYSNRYASFDAKFLKTLQQNAWLPDKHNDFGKPSNIPLSELNDEFDIESQEAKNLAEKLGVKKDIEQELLNKFPELKEKIEFAKTLTEDEIKLIEEKRKREKESIGRNHEELNYNTELKKAYNRHQMKESEKIHIPPGSIPDVIGRIEKTRENIIESINNEPLTSERFKRVPAKRWEQKNNEVRTFLKEQYGGRCQICNYTFFERDGEPYFEGLYQISRIKAIWIDRPGNVLCLCANCCAKFEHGSVEADDILEQIKSIKFSKEIGLCNTNIKIKLCGESVELKFSERHIIDLQGILKVNMRDDS